MMMWNWCSHQKQKKHVHHYIAFKSIIKCNLTFMWIADVMWGTQFWRCVQIFKGEEAVLILKMREYGSIVVRVECGFKC